jgi:phosphatidylglycerophosphate synthase
VNRMAGAYVSEWWCSRAHDERGGVVRSDPMTGLAAQLVVLVVLAATVGLGLAGWVTGLASALITVVLLQRALSRSGSMEFGPADWVTLTRMSLVGGVAALTADSFHLTAPVGVLVSIVVVALLLDWVDGQVARRTGTASEFGARFDMEVDSFLLLVLSVYAARSSGAWVLVFGGMRYAFLAAGWVLPWMRAQLPPRYWRKVVATAEGVVLVLAVADLLPRPLTLLALVAAMCLLVESFGRDVLWLWDNRPSGPRRRVRDPAGAEPRDRG